MRRLRRSLAVSASETAVSTTVLQAERDQHEAGFLPAIFQGLPAPRQKLPEISPTFKADAVRLHVSREKDKEIALGRSRMGRYEGRSAGRLRASSQEPSNIGCGFARRATAKKSDHRHRRLLRPRRERPSHRRAAEERDEIAPFHSITSSARNRNDSEIVRPSALAVLRLTASSNFSADCTGNSLGLAPFKILSM